VSKQSEIPGIGERRLGVAKIDDTYDKHLAKAAMLLLEQLLCDTAAMSGGGHKMTSLCLGCETRGVHAAMATPCPCACHKVRAFLAEFKPQ
jgi:hypothetical protein